MTDFTKQPKEKLKEVLDKFNQHKTRIEKINKRIEGLETELSELDPDKDFDEYHLKNQEVSYYEDQLAIAVDGYEMERVHDRMNIESSLYSPIVKGLMATRKSINYESKKKEIVQSFTEEMNKLGKEHNNKILKYIEGIYPELEQLKDHFGDTDFKHFNLMQVTTPYYHYKQPLNEYLEENSKKN